MSYEKIPRKNIIFFYHKNHSDRYNGTSVYDKALLDILSEDFNINTIEPENTFSKVARVNGVNAHYFVNLMKTVYLRQVRWLVGIIRGKHLTSSENTLLLVEDVYSGPIPFLVSKLRGYKLLYRAADFGESYSQSLFPKHPLERFLYKRARELVEGLLIRRASLVICPSQAVENAIKKKFPALRCKFALLPYTKKPNSTVYTNSFPSKANPTTSRRPVLLFLGDCRYPPNYDAARYILRELVPKLNGFNNDFTLLIAGANSDQFFNSGYPNVRVLGPVENTDDLFKNAQIGIAPIRTSGGLSMKIVDYLTHGLRVVATPEAAFGIVANDQTRLSEISDFADAVSTEIVREQNNGHDDHVICPQVAETYMTDKWAADLRRTIADLESSQAS